MNRAPLLALPALLLTSFAYACDHAGEPWKAADTDKDGNISSAEAGSAWPRLAKGFASVDKDSDGQLTPSEMDAARDGWRDHRRDDLREKFQAADKDGDHALNLAEAQVAFPQLAESFTSLDTDNDGKLTPEELRALHKRR